MTNEYGERLDRNNYAKSLISEPDKCYMCDAINDLIRHEVFPGVYRQNSKKLGLWVNLCPYHHMLLHSKPRKMVALKQEAQQAAMEHFDWTMEEWRLHFGKNWL